MSATLKLLTVQETLAVAGRIRAASDGDLRRVVSGASLNAIASLAVLVGQLDVIAQAAAAVDLARWPADGSPASTDAIHDAHETLAGALKVAGYLAATPNPEEAPDGQS